MASMKSRELFGKTFACVCGRTHRIVPAEVVYSEEVFEALPAVCSRVVRGRRAAVLMDVRTREVAGARVAAALRQAGWEVAEVLVPDPPGGGSPVCDESTRDAAGEKLGQVDLVLPVGSGVINDLGKCLSHQRDLGYVSFATAASMNGYASSNVALTVRGVKTLLYARAPAAVLTSPDIIRDAPYEMTASGLGDVLAKSVSSTDWRLNHVLFGDYYCRRSVDLIADIEPLYMSRPEKLRQKDPQATEALFDALLLTGVAMTMAETSFPASGAEHMISHCLDMMSSVDGVAHDLHGRQVGVGTILTSELYRRVLALDSPAPAEVPEAIDAVFWGPLADVMAEQYAGKTDRLRTVGARLVEGSTWDDLRSELAPMLRPPETVRDCLRRAGAAASAGDIGCDRERLLEALLHAHEIRSRFTILDLARVVGVMPAAAQEIIEQWA